VVKQRIAPGRRNDMPPTDGGSIQKSRRIYVRPRTGSAVRTSLVAGGGSAAGSRRVHINPRQLRRGQTDGRIALFQNAPLGLHCTGRGAQELLSMRQTSLATEADLDSGRMVTCRDVDFHPELGSELRTQPLLRSVGSNLLVDPNKLSR